MKIQSISVKNFLGLRQAQITPSAQITLIAGLNRSGKSSLIDAIRFAFLGAPLRVSKKSDLPLLTGGGDGEVSITADGHTVTRSVRTGRAVGSQEVHPALGYVLDAQSFARLDDKARRTFLVGLSGVKLTSEDVFSRAVGLECDKDKLDVIRPMFRAGFDGVSQDSSRRGTEAKGAWHQVTGEQWGSKKAESWTAEVPAAVPGNESAAGRIEAIEDELTGLQQRIGQAKEAAKTARRAEFLRTKAERVDRLTLEMEEAKGSVNALAVHIENMAQIHALGGGLVTSYTCPHCGVEDRVVVHQGKITQATENTTDPAATGELMKLRMRYGNEGRNLRQLESNLIEARGAAQALSALSTNDEQDGDVDGIEVRANRLQRELAKLRGDVQASTVAARERGQAIEKTKKARQLHVEITEWLKISETFSPLGIPAAITVDAVMPVHKRIEKMCAQVCWQMPIIGPDMSITMDGRDYRLLSESERWRVDTLFAEAIAHLSGLRLLVLDRMDVLDLPSRAEFMAAMTLIKSDYDSIIVAGTLKRCPALPPYVQCYWLENGSAKTHT